jgi:hypothetical protein
MENITFIFLIFNRQAYLCIAVHNIRHLKQLFTNTGFQNKLLVYWAWLLTTGNVA